MQRLSGVDANFLYQETPTALMHTLKIELVRMREGTITLESLKSAVEPLLVLAPQLRRRVVFVPFDLHHPVWVDDPDFDVEFHICRAALPAPGGRAELEEMLAQIASHPLDRERPLWELWVLTGLADPTLAVAVHKIHHAMADGMASLRLLTRIYSSPRPAPEQTWQPAPLPSGRRLVWDALVDHVLHDVRNLPAVVSGLWHALRRIGRLRKTAQELPALEAAYLKPLPRTRFNRALTPKRVIAMRQVSLERVRALRACLEGSVNDVVLALVAGALRSYLLHHGELTDTPLAASVPTAVDEPGSARDLGNRVAALGTRLRTDLADPVERYAAIRRSTLAGKTELEAMGRHTYENLLQYVPPFLTIWRRRRAFRRRVADRPTYRPQTNLVVSNVPGPPQRLVGDSGDLVDLFSMGVLPEGCALNITVWSYAGNLNFTLLSCKKAVPDLARIADALEPALEELITAARRRLQSPPTTEPS